MVFSTAAGTTLKALRTRLGRRGFRGPQDTHHAKRRAHLSPFRGPCFDPASEHKPNTLLHAKLAMSTRPSRTGLIKVPTKTGAHNFFIQAEGLRDIQDLVAQDPTFVAIHTDEAGVTDFNKTLPPIKKLEAVSYFTNVDFFDGKAATKENIREDLDDCEILRIARFFNEEAIDQAGQDEILELARMGWSSTFLTDEKGNPIIMDEDVDDHTLHAMHPNQHTLPAALQGKYQYTTVMKSKVFHIFRMLRHDTLMTIATDSDRRIQYNHVNHFVAYKAALTGRLPYQTAPEFEDFIAQTNIFTTHDHAQAIYELAGDFRKADSFFDLPYEDQVTIALSMFGKKAGLKPKTKQAYLRNRKKPGRSPITLDNSQKNLMAGQIIGNQKGIRVPDRDRNPISFYGSHFLHALVANSRLADTLVSAATLLDSDAAGVPQFRENLRLMILGYSHLFAQAERFDDVATLKLVADMLSPQGQDYVDLNDTERKGSAGRIFEYSDTTSFFIREALTARFGIRTNYRSAQNAIHMLRMIAASKLEYTRIQKFYEEEVAPKLV